MEPCFPVRQIWIFEPNIYLTPQEYLQKVFGNSCKLDSSTIVLFCNNRTLHSFKVNLEEEQCHPIRLDKNVYSSGKTIPIPFIRVFGMKWKPSTSINIHLQHSYMSSVSYQLSSGETRRSSSNLILRQHRKYC